MLKGFVKLFFPMLKGHLRDFSGRFKELSSGVQGFFEGLLRGCSRDLQLTSTSGVSFPPRF